MMDIFMDPTVQFCVGAPITLLVLYIFVSGLSYGLRPPRKLITTWCKPTPEEVAANRARIDEMIRRAESDREF